MPALSFKKKFVHAIETGQKRQTIRLLRKRPIKAGDTLHLFTGLRTADCQKITAVKCTSVESIEIYPTHIKVGERVLNMRERVALAQADGFDSLAKFYDFFMEHYGTPFVGVIIKWEAGAAS